jgi:hypothetical protein
MPNAWLKRRFSTPNSPRRMQFGQGAILEYPARPKFEDEDDEDSLPDEALVSALGRSVSERSRENQAPCGVARISCTGRH